MDSSHLRKYLATLGVAIVGASISLAGLFFRLQGELLLSSKEISETTPLARETIAARQQYLATATTWLPLALSVGVAAGIALMIYGLRGWSARQKVMDEIEDIARDRSLTELRSLTDAERVDRLEKEAQDTVRVQSEEGNVPSTATATEAPEQGPIDGAVSAARALVAETELSVATKLRDAFADRYTVEFGVEVRVGADRRGIDFLVRDADKAVLAIEVGISNRKNVWNRVVDYVSRVVPVAEALGPDALPVVLIVTRDDLPRTSALTDRINEYAASFRRRPRIVVMNQVDLEDVDPQELAVLLGAPSK